MREKQKIINLYGDVSISSIKHVISIGSEEDLNQFWHYFHMEVKQDYQLLYGFISLMYAFTSRFFEEEQKLFFELIIEQSEESFYVTLWNARISEEIEKYVKHSERNSDYRKDKKRICFRMKKDTLLEDKTEYSQEKENRSKEIIASLQDKVCLIRRPYDFLEEEDKTEILNGCDDLVDIMYRSKGKNISKDNLIHLRSSLSMLSLHLNSYTRLENVCHIIIELSVLINTNMKDFEALKHEEMTLLEGFVNNIDRWATTLFVTGGADLHFMDSSLRADLEMIKTMLTKQEHQEILALDDIFDF